VLTSPHSQNNADTAAICHAAEYHSAALVRRKRLHPRELEDTRQELLVSLLECWPRFDSRLSKARTFADRVARTRVINLAKATSASRRGGGTTQVSLSEVEAAPWAATPPPGDPLLRRDVLRAVQNLSVQDQAICTQLALDNVSAAARCLGLSRAALRRRIVHIRTVFLDHGLRAYLEAA